jgi:hypothetical protein
MRRLLFIPVICLLSFARAYSQDSVPTDAYIASKIPDSLETDANSVVRYSMEDYDIKGPGKAIYKAHTIVTILNEKGNREAQISLPSNKKFSAVSSFEMRIYDATGKLIKKYHKSDMYEHAAEDDETLVTDDRIQSIVHTVASYPTTVEMTYEIDKNSLINIGGWIIQLPEQSVQSMDCRLSISSSAGFKYFNKNTVIKPQKGSEGDKDVYVWHTANLKAFKIEEGTMSWRVIPGVYFSQNKFEYYGYPGDISSWQNYGKWVYDLNKDVCTLSSQRVAEIKKMTDSVKTDKEKAKFLYEYLQKSMRYVSVDLGIGGYKPFDANFVDQKKYGDCKALANYMYALLKAVDIKSYWAVIRRGTNEYAASPDFPYNSFNHEILCVPFKTDTAWLDCTDTYQPFGTLDITTLNRNALLITEDGGKLVNTPKSKAQENQFNSEAHIILDADGGAKTQVKILSTGEYRGLYLGMAAIKMDDQKEFLLRDLHIKQPSAFDFKSEKDENGTKEIDLNFEYDQFCDVKAGDKQFYRPLAFLLWDGKVPMLEKRKTDYYWDYPRIKTCTTTIDLPSGFEVETLPANANLKFTYGNYELNYVYNKDKNQVISTAKFILNNHVIPATKYTEMQQYMDAIAKAQNKKLVIKKKA